jgi:hypothetical protein
MVWLDPGVKLVQQRKEINKMEKGKMGKWYIYGWRKNMEVGREKKKNLYGKMMF